MNQAENKPYSIAQLGHNILRLKATEVSIEHLLDDDIQQLISKMMLAVSQAGGVGIAAPQIHHSLRIFIICSKQNTH